MTTLSPSVVDKMRSRAANYFAWSALLGLTSIALAVAWFIGIRAVNDPPPPNMRPAQGYITFIEPVRFSKDYTYIHLGIKTDTKAGNQMETWYYREELHRFAPALKSLRIGDFIKASTIPAVHGNAMIKVIELRRGEDVILTFENARAYREDEAVTCGVAALVGGPLAAVLGLIYRFLMIRAEKYERAQHLGIFTV